MRYEDPNSAIIAVVGIVFAILLAATTLAAQGFYYWSEQEEFARKNDAPNAAMTELRATQTEHLEAYGRDAETGIVTIPADRAAELLITERAAQ